MEEKLRHEKEKGRKSGEDSDDQTKNEIEDDGELPGGTVEEAADEINETSLLVLNNIMSSTDKSVIISSTDPIDSLTVPTTTQSVHADETDNVAIRSSSEEDQQNFVVLTSERPPPHHFNVEHERLEVIEIKHDGASGHLSHDI